MSATETIREYLVSLGFDVDKSSYDQANKAMDSFGERAAELAGNMTASFGKAAAAVVAFGAATTAATAKFLGGLGNQEIQMEILSRQLWTTQQQAMAFNATLQAMGANLQQLYLSPTLMAQYKQLHGVALQMQTPGDYNQQVQQIQDVQLQIKQLRLEAYYGLQWVGYYFIKYMDGPISKVHNVLQSINKVIVKNMPTWTKQVAAVMVSFMKMGMYTVQAIKDVWDWLTKMANYMPMWSKIVGGALALISVSNPFMLFVEGISAAILLLDDFKTYVSGGKSAFPQLWAWVVKTGKALDKLGIPQRFEDNIKALGKTLSDLGKSTDEFASSIGNLYDATQGQKGQGIVGFFQLIADTLSGAEKTLMTVIAEVSGMMKVNSDLIHGNPGGAAVEFAKMLTGQNLVQNGIITQQQTPAARIQRRLDKLPQAHGVNHPNYFNPKNAGAFPNHTSKIAKPGANGWPWVKKGYNPYAKVAHVITHHTAKSVTIHAPVTQHIHTTGSNTHAVSKNAVSGFRPALLAAIRGIF